MTRSNEKGVALVFTLFLMAALSAMAVSMMFLAQTETSASRNYKTMSQARYAGEAGVHRALHYLSSDTYSNAVTTTTGFNTTVSPVTLTANGNPVVLTPYAASCPVTLPSCQLSNHPSTTIKDAYAALFTGTAAQLSVGNGANVSYTATATLLSMRSVTVAGSSPKIIQTWRIAATGTVPGVRPATVEVAAVLERGVAPSQTYAIFATGNGCEAIRLAGGAMTDSYDSNSINWDTSTPPKPIPDERDGAVGTNGNLTLDGGATVNGNLDTPRTGVGNCSNGNVTALDPSQQAQVRGDKIRLPQPKTYPTPDPPTPTPPTSTLNLSATTTCLSLTILPGVIPVGAVCSGSPGNLTIQTNGAKLSWGNVSMTGGARITLSGGSSSNVEVNVNSWSLAGGSQVTVGAASSVTLKAMGAGIPSNQSVIDFTGGAVTNASGGAASYDSSKFQIIYAGDGTIKVGGNSDTAATIYAPNAFVEMAGSAGFYGSVLSKKFKYTSGAGVHYDRGLQEKYMTLAQHVMSSFSWQKY